MEVKVESLGKVCVTVDKDYWSSEKSYDKLVIVEVAGVGTFISRKPVPARTNINDRIYWIPITVQGGGGGTVPISQDFGDSETITVSQKTLTEKVNSLQDKGGYVRFDQDQSESLTEEQKEIARNNIGAEDAITVDNALSDTSENPVQNKVVKAAIDNIQGGADKEYNPAEFSGLGRVYLKKNIVEVGGVEKNVLTQSAFYKDGTQTPNTDTMFIVQYDFDLNGQTINVPERCVLVFDGGSLKNGTIIGQDTFINNVGGVADIFGLGIDKQGTWREVGDLANYYTKSELDSGEGKRPTVNEVEEMIEQGGVKPEDVVPIIEDNAISYKSEQTLTNSEKLLAQTNIGVVVELSPTPYSSKVPTSGGVHAAISNAATAIEASVETQLRTKADTNSVYTKDEIEAKEDAIEAQIGSLDNSKADKATTLAGYGINNAYTKGESNQAIDNKVTIETNRATAAEQDLMDIYTALTRSDIVVMEKATWDAKDWTVTPGVANTIYRVSGTTDYSDYMFKSTDLQHPVKMATYKNATDANPTESSQNLVTSGGAFTNNVLAGGDYTVTRHLTPVSNVATITIPARVGTVYKMVLPRIVYNGKALQCDVYDGTEPLRTIAKYYIPVAHTDAEFGIYVLSNTGNLTLSIGCSAEADINIKMIVSDSKISNGGSGEIAGVFHVCGEIDSGSKVIIIGSVLPKVLPTDPDTHYAILQDYLIGRYRFKIIGKNVSSVRFASDSETYSFIPFNINGEGLYDLTEEYVEDTVSLRIYSTVPYDEEAETQHELDVCMVFYKVGDAKTLEEVAEKSVTPTAGSNLPITSAGVYNAITNTFRKTGAGFNIGVTTIAGTGIDTTVELKPYQLYKVSFPRIDYTASGKTYKSRITIFERSVYNYVTAETWISEEHDEYFMYFASPSGRVVIRIYANDKQSVNVVFEPVSLVVPFGSSIVRSYGAYKTGDNLSGKFIYSTTFANFTPGKYKFKILGVENIRAICPIAGTTMYDYLTYDGEGNGYLNITQAMISGGPDEKIDSFRFYSKLNDAGERVLGKDFWAYMVLFKSNSSDDKETSNVFDFYQDANYISKIQTLKKRTPYSYSTAENFEPLCLLWFSDLHGNLDTLNGMYSWYNKYEAYIDDVVNCGDTVTDSLLQYDAVMDSYFEIIENYPNILIPGNHDVIGSQNLATSSAFRYWAALGDYSIKDIYDNFTARMNYASRGCIQPSDAAENGYNFFYKDYNENVAGKTSLRLVVIDTAINKDAVSYYEQHKSNNDPSPDSSVKAATIAYDNTQKQWLAFVLSDAMSKNLSVVIATHCPPNSRDFKMGNSFAEYGGPTTSPESYGALSDDYLDIVQDFIDNGGEFICWLCGHYHKDRIGLTVKHGQLSIIINTANSRLSNVSNFNPNRVENSDTQYAFNHIAFDTYLKRITLLRIGCNYDLYGRKKDMLVVDYANKKPFDELYKLFALGKTQEEINAEIIARLEALENQ